MSHTSDHFDLIADFARQLIREGNAYMDDTPVEQMRKERGDMVESKRRCVSPTVPRPCAAWRRGRCFVIFFRQFVMARGPRAEAPRLGGSLVSMCWGLVVVGLG